MLKLIQMLSAGYGVGVGNRADSRPAQEQGAVVATTAAPISVAVSEHAILLWLSVSSPDDHRSTPTSCVRWHWQRAAPTVHEVRTRCWASWLGHDRQRWRGSPRPSAWSCTTTLAGSDEAEDALGVRSRLLPEILAAPTSSRFMVPLKPRPGT